MGPNDKVFLEGNDNYDDDNKLLWANVMQATVVFISDILTT
jgi:hypothetical protein